MDEEFQAMLRERIRRWQGMLETENDDAARAALETLIAEAEDQLREANQRR